VLRHGHLAHVVFSEVDTRVAVPIAQGTLRRVARIPASGGARETLGERRGDGGVRELVVAGSEIVWRDDTGVFSTPLAGGTTTAPAAAPLPASYGYDSILPAGGTIYCTASSRLFATPGFVAPLAGGAIAGPLSLPRLFASDATHLYWHQMSGLLARAPRPGGPVEHLAGGFAGRPSITLGADRLLGATGWVVQAVGFGGGVAEEVFLADDTIGRLVASNDGFYAFTNLGDVWRVPAAGEATKISRVGALSGRVAAAGGHVYFAEYEPPPSMGVSILRVPSTGGGREVVASGLAGVEDLLVRGEFVYFKELAGAIRRVPVTGGPSTALTGRMDGPMTLATDDTNLYAANDTAIVKVPLAGGATVTLLSTQFIGPSSLAVDGTSVYWADTYWEAIFRLSPK
jgi:hypothetical protein